MIAQSIGRLLCGAFFFTLALEMSAETPLAHHRWEHRLLLIFAPSAKDPSLRALEAALAKHQPELADREIVVYRFVDGEKATRNGVPLEQSIAEQIHAEYGPPPDRFLLLLIGKDGTVKRRSLEPVPLETLFGQIDQMPMRKREMQDKSAHP
ncbi:MAG: DUF4174 domain-containing protein [Opitutales bacterium]